MNNFKKTLLNEIPEFRDYTLNYLNGNISTMQYKEFAAGYGVYSELNKKLFLIRLRISCGIMSRSQLHTIYQIANKNNLKSIHITTRQSIQFQDLDMDTTVNIMKQLIENDIYTKGSGGNFPRNVGLSPLSGVNIKESFDVTPYALATDKYFLNKINTYNLPRKFKVYYSNDYAYAITQDMGFIATLKENKPYFEVYVGGSLGKEPKVGLKLPHLINPSDALFYIEGMIEFFKSEGDYKNKHKSKISYIIDKLGKDEFLKRLYLYIDKQRQNINLKIKGIIPKDELKYLKPIDYIGKMVEYIPVEINEEKNMVIGRIDKILNDYTYPLENEEDVILGTKLQGAIKDLFPTGCFIPVSPGKDVLCYFSPSINKNIDIEVGSKVLFTINKNCDGKFRGKVVEVLR